MLWLLYWRMLWWTGMIATRTINYPLQLSASQFTSMLWLHYWRMLWWTGMIQLVELIIPYSSQLVNLHLCCGSTTGGCSDGQVWLQLVQLIIPYSSELVNLHLCCGSTTGGCSDGQVWLQLVQLIIPYSTELINLNLDYIYAVAPLLEDALMDRYDCNSYN